jgi:hypothetical protein
LPLSQAILWETVFSLLWQLNPRVCRHGSIRIICFIQCWDGVFSRVWQFVGWGENFLLPLQVFSALCGALSVGLVYYINHIVTRSFKIALLVSLGYAFSHAIWLYSTDIEVVTLFLLMNLVVLAYLFSLLSQESRPALSFMLLGLLVGVSILVYQASVFMIPAVLIALFLANRQGDIWCGRFKEMFLFVAGTVLLILPVYLLVAYFAYGIRDWYNLLAWQFHMSEYGLWGNLSAGNLVQGFYAFLRTLVGYPGLGVNDRTSQYLANVDWFHRFVFAIVYLIVMVFAGLPVLVAVIKRQLLRRLAPEFVAVISTWALLNGAFAIYWVPGDMQFWAPVVVSWWLLVGMVIKIVDDVKVLKWLSPIEILLAGVVVLLVINALGVILPNRDIKRNHAYQIALSVQEQTSPRDLIVTSGGDRLFLYIPYFSGRRTISVFHQMLMEKGDKELVFTEIEKEVELVNARGDRAFLVGVQPGRTVWWDMLGTLTPEDFERFETMPSWSVAGEMISEIHISVNDQEESE